MSTNPFKSFIPFIVTGDATRNPLLEGDADEHASVDPSAGQWRTVGLVPPLKGEIALHVDLEGAASLMCVQFNERILPGKVRDEQVAKKVKKIEDLEGRKVSKKEYATIRDEVEFEMLPKAFIRRTQVPVIFRRDRMLVCTSSEKKATDAVACLSALFGIDALYPWRMAAKQSVSATLTAMARSDDGSNYFEAGTAAVLKGEDKQTVRIKDISVDADKVQALIEDGDYRVVELGLNYFKNGVPGDSSTAADLSIIVNEHLAFKRIDLVNIKATDYKEDMFALALICAKTFTGMLTYFLEACGGAEERPAREGNDEDEL